MEPRYDGRLAMSVATDRRGPWALPTDEYVGLGRAPGLGLQVDENWVPSRVCRFMPYEIGWLVQLGRARARISNKYLGDLTFAARTVVALQPGRTRITFPELDDELDLRVVIGAGEAQGLPVARNVSALVEGSPELERTRYLGADIDLTAQQRTVLAVAFEHLMHDEARWRGPAAGLERHPTPTNVAAHAAARLGVSEQAVKNTIMKTRKKLNEQRWLDLHTTDQVGHYLVRYSRIITPADLP